MKILFVNPKCPDTFWSFRHALKFVSKKASGPPLGLLTVAALLPKAWIKRLVDMDVEELQDDQILWADYIFIGAMSVQRNSAMNIIRRCKSLNAKVVVGGPLFTACYEEFPFELIDHFVLNEAEITLPLFLRDLENGHPQRIYKTNDWADIESTPTPLWELINFKNYAGLNLQYSRGCPYDCEFCDITVLFGRKPRTKTKEQVIKELSSIYLNGWRGNVFVVDDNFIGNKVKVKKEILPAITDWMKEHHRPFTFGTEASLNLADDEQLIYQMTNAGFNSIFVGIESPNEDSLAECGKSINRNRNLISSVNKLQQAGLEVQGGFILGFDSDPSSIFDRLSAFIQESGIVTAMVGLLNAPRGTKLYKRLAKEGRLLQSISGDNTDASINFKPKMNYKSLIEGYQEVLRNIYTPENYYRRVRIFLKSYKPAASLEYHSNYIKITALLKSVFWLGIVGKERYQYWNLFFWSLFRRPRLFPLAITQAIYGFHFRKVFEQHLS